MEPDWIKEPPGDRTSFGLPLKSCSTKYCALAACPATSKNSRCRLVEKSLIARLDFAETAWRFPPYVKTQNSLAQVFYQTPEKFGKRKAVISPSHRRKFCP